GARHICRERGWPHAEGKAVRDRGCTVARDGRDPRLRSGTRYPRRSSRQGVPGVLSGGRRGPPKRHGARARHRERHRHGARWLDGRRGYPRWRRHDLAPPPARRAGRDVKVLAVDDEPQILRALRASLAARGHDVLTAPNGETALDTLATTEVDLVVLDLGLPGIDGLEVIRRLRSWSQVPVIVLSVREAQADKIAALDAGADDFVTKPFAMDELLARTRAVLRRIGPGTPESPVVRAGDLEVDLSHRAVTRAGEPVHLTPTEYALLELLVANPGKLLTHRFLLRKVWGDGYQAQSNYLRVYVAGLRKKLEEDPTAPVRILTEPGVGYRWAAEGGSEAAG